MSSDPACISVTKENTAELEVKMSKQHTASQVSMAGWVYASVAMMQKEPWWYTQEEALEVAKKAEAKGETAWIPDEQFPGRKDCSREETK